MHTLLKELKGAIFHAICHLSRKLKLSLRAISPNWVSKAIRARTRERAAKPRGQVWGDGFHALRCPGVSGVEIKIYKWPLQALFSLPRRFRVSSRVPLARLLFKTCLYIYNWTPKTMVQFCYLRLYLDFKKRFWSSVPTDDKDGNGFVDRLGKLPSKEQQLSRTQHFILRAHAAIFVLHIQYGPRGTPLTPMIQRQNCLLSTDWDLRKLGHLFQFWMLRLQKSPKELL